MIARVRARAVVAPAGASVRAAVGDAHDLNGIPEASVSAVTAIGLVPWLHSPERALSEIERVLVPGGALVLTADNRRRLTHLVDPRLNPSSARLRAALREWLQNRGWRARDPHPRGALHASQEVQGLLEQAGFSVQREDTVGFGPFTLAGRPVLGRSAALRLNHDLQRRADAGDPLLRAHGSHILVVARKSGTAGPAGPAADGAAGRRDDGRARGPW